MRKLLFVIAAVLISISAVMLVASIMRNDSMMFAYGFVACMSAGIVLLGADWFTSKAPSDEEYT